MKGVKKYSVLVILTAWLIVIAFFMILNRMFDLEIFFVLAFIGFLAVVALIDGIFPRPRYINYLVAAGVALLACLIAKRILLILTV